MIAARSALALALTALALTGCGGGQDTGTGQSTEAGQAFETNPQSPASTTPNKPPVDLPPPTPGAKGPAPGVPTSPKGDNSIQTWGLEASDAQRARASAIVRAYLDARAEGAWGKVCSLLAAKVRAEQERAGGNGCAAAMAFFAEGADPATMRAEAQVDVLSFRVGDRYAFLIYRRADGVFTSALTREGGGWRLISVTPNPVS